MYLFLFFSASKRLKECDCEVQNNNNSFNGNIICYNDKPKGPLVGEPSQQGWFIHKYIALSYQFHLYILSRLYQMGPHKKKTLLVENTHWWS